MHGMLINRGLGLANEHSRNRTCCLGMAEARRSDAINISLHSATNIFMYLGVMHLLGKNDACALTLIIYAHQVKLRVVMSTAGIKSTTICMLAPFSIFTNSRVWVPIPLN